MGPIRNVMRRSAAILAMPAFLSACAVSTPVSVKPTIVELQTATSVEFPTMEETGSLRSQWGTALQAAFSNKSVGVQKDAPFLVDFALSVRESDSGLAAVTESSEEVDWQSEPRREKFLDRCKAQRMRGTLVIFRRADGAIIYRGESEANACEFGAEEMADMANQLVDNAVN